MDHGPSADWGKDAAAAYKSRLGIWLFLLYSLGYALFVALNLYNPLSMEITVIFGLNLATVFGLGLIVVALLLALVYNWLCQRQEKRLAGTSKKPEVN